jgi:tRNA(fMet)-specific endonuclease VapC
VKFLLDSDTCIEHLRHGTNSAVTLRLNQVPAADIVLCSVVRAELITGALKSSDPQRHTAAVLQFISRFLSLPFDDRAADRYAEVRADLERRGLPIGPNDYLIAAIALANNLSLITRNLAEFLRVPGLACEDWNQAAGP